MTVAQLIRLLSEENPKLPVVIALGPGYETPVIINTRARRVVVDDCWLPAKSPASLLDGKRAAEPEEVILLRALNA